MQKHCCITKYSDVRCGEVNKSRLLIVMQKIMRNKIKRKTYFVATKLVLFGAFCGD